IQKQLDLQWLRRETPAPAALPAPWILPAHPDLVALGELSAIGYVRGLQEKLDSIEAETPDTAAFIGSLRKLLKNFRLDEINRALKEAEDECTDHSH
ncbi:hypothetical protein, partial [Pseudomonas gingeri]